MRWWPTLREVLAHLRERDLLTEAEDEDGIVAAAGALRPPSPWYLRTALFFAGIFAGFVLACSCGPFAALSDGVLFLVPGVLVPLLCTAGRWIRPEGLGEWVDPLLFAGMIGGKLMLLAGITAVLSAWGAALFDEHTTSIVAAIFGLAELLFLVIYPDRWHRTLATVIVCACLATISWDLSLWPIRDVVTGIAVVAGAATLAARPLFAGTPLRTILEPVGLGFVLYALGGMGRFWTGWAEEGWIAAIGAATGLLALLVVGWALSRVRSPAHGYAVVLPATVIVMAMAVSMPGLSVALVFMVLALIARDVAVLVVSVISIVVYGAVMYTGFEWPVALKALALVGSGGVLLGLRLYLRAVVPDVSTATGATAAP